MTAAIPHRFQTTLLITLAAALAFGSACPAVATTIIVDNFTAGTADLNITALAPPTQTASDLETGLTGVLGGSRELTIRKISGTSGNQRNVAGSVDSNEEQLLYSSGSGVTGSMTLLYDANATGLNLSLNPLLDTFLLEFIEGDYSASRTIPVLITITASNDQSGTLSQTLAVEQSPVFLEFSVASFSNLAGMNLSTNPLKSIQIDFSPAATSADFTLGAITIVPEPSMQGLALAGLCLTGYSILSRKSCRRSA